MARSFSIQHVAKTPPGWRVRTVIAGKHRVRVAFPPGSRKKGDGIPVEILHPRNENPVCLRNPGELLLMGANPMGSARNAGKGELQRQARDRASRIRAARLHNAGAAYDSLDVQERLAFGRLGLGKAQLRSQADIRRARKKVREVNRFANAFPNPLADVDSPAAEHAAELYESFHETPSEKYVVREEPHIPAGDYALLGKLIALRVKPELGGQVQEISFPGKNISVISTANGERIYFAGAGQELDAAEVNIFSSSDADRAELGECRSIVYAAAKWHEAVPPSVRGTRVEWEHQFGEDGGYPPKVFYLRGSERLALEGGSYHVEGAGIVN